MTEEEKEKEKEWHRIVHNENSKVIDKKRAFLLFLKSRFNKPYDNSLSYDIGEWFGAIKKAEDKEEEEEKNNNINLNKNEISRSTSQNVGQYNIDKKNIAEKENKNNVNNSQTNNEINEIYNKKSKDMGNDSELGKDDINKAIKENNINKNII